MRALLDFAISNLSRTMLAGIILVVCMMGSALALEACWSEASMLRRDGDERIAKGVRGAFIGPPKRQPLQYTPLQPAQRGVIRRVKLPPGKKLVALTFDLCEQPHEIAGYQGKIVDFLRANGIRATFFAGGKWMLTHRTRAEQLMTDPHFEVGNHTWEHRNLRLLSGTALYDEIARAQVSYEDVREGLSKRRCIVPGTRRLAQEIAPQRLSIFRFPFGACDQKSQNAVADLGLKAVQWDVSSGDPWIGQKAAAMADSVVKQVRPGSIVLFHANGRGHHTETAVPEIVNRLRAEKYQFVTVSQLLSAGVPEYARPAHGCYDSRPGDTDKYDALAARLEAAYKLARARALGISPPKTLKPLDLKHQTPTTLRPLHQSDQPVLVAPPRRASPPATSPPPGGL